MKIYTKTGDKGETSLFGGERVAKSHPRVRAYGTVDELNSFIGLLKDQDMSKEHKDFLLTVQKTLFSIGSHLATTDKKLSEMLPKITDSEVEVLEKEIDRLTNDLPKMTHFILPGGHTTISYAHIARSTCRRAERRVHEVQEQVEGALLKYLNRLSDYLFTLARTLGQELNVEEVKWEP